MAIASHVSRRMLERYSHIRMEAKRTALEGLSGRRLEGYGTKYGTMAIQCLYILTQFYEGDG